MLSGEGIVPSDTPLQTVVAAPRTLAARMGTSASKKEPRELDHTTALTFSLRSSVTSSSLSLMSFHLGVPLGVTLLPRGVLSEVTPFPRGVPRGVLRGEASCLNIGPKNGSFVVDGPAPAKRTCLCRLSSSMLDCCWRATVDRGALRTQ